jgi:hypothetical protein
MVEVRYHCPYCGAITSVDRDPALHDESVTREPLGGWSYAQPSDVDAGDAPDADGIEFVCLGNADVEAGPSEAPADSHREGGANDPVPGKDGCGRTFYLNFVKYEDGQPVEHREPNIDPPRFDFRKK